MTITELYKTMLENAKNGEDNELVEFIADQVDVFRKYVNSVVEMEIRIPVARFRMETEDFQRFAERLDTNRRKIHERAIDSCRILNRLCDKMGLEAFYPRDLEDRYQVADFCWEIVSELFRNGQHLDIQELAARGEYI